MSAEKSYSRVMLFTCLTMCACVYTRVSCAFVCLFTGLRVWRQVVLQSRDGAAGGGDAGQTEGRLQQSHQQGERDDAAAATLPRPARRSRARAAQVYGLNCAPDVCVIV